MSSLWYDAADNLMRGVKFVPVTITGVTPGNKVFPLRVSFTDSDGMDAGMWMSVRSEGSQAGSGASRWFGNLFSLSDPRLGHPDMDDAVWGNDLCRQSQGGNDQGGMPAVARESG